VLAGCQASEQTLHFTRCARLIPYRVPHFGGAVDAVAVWTPGSVDLGRTSLIRYARTLHHLHIIIHDWLSPVAVATLLVPSSLGVTGRSSSIAGYLFHFAGLWRTLPWRCLR